MKWRNQRKQRNENGYESNENENNGIIRRGGGNNENNELKWRNEK
jgi:hypothetical protein